MKPLPSKPKLNSKSYSLICQQCQAPPSKQANSYRAHRHRVLSSDLSVSTSFSRGDIGIGEGAGLDEFHAASGSPIASVMHDMIGDLGRTPDASRQAQCAQRPTPQLGRDAVCASVRVDTNRATDHAMGLRVCGACGPLLMTATTCRSAP
jgi:hypothetical protein